MPMASCAITTSPAPAAGASISIQRIMSDPPGRAAAIAYVIIIAPFAQSPLRAWFVYGKHMADMLSIFYNPVT